MSRLLHKQRSREAGIIATRAYDMLKETTGEGIRRRGFPAVRRRVLELLEVYENHHMLAVLVEEVAARDKEGFGPKSLSLVRLGEMVQRAHVPDDAWEYERWWRALPSSEIKDEAEDLLAHWRDAEQICDRQLAKGSQRALGFLQNQPILKEDLITR